MLGMTETEQILEEGKLVYVTDSMPGIYRKDSAGGYVYTDRNGRIIHNEKTLERIKKLVLPPAWQNVWIAKNANAHLQATGIDAAGRKQYRYHPLWSKYRNENKFYRLLEFGKKPPEFRKNLKKDLMRRNMDQRKVLAIAVDVMQKTLIRIGNESYKNLYGSYGLTTLRDKHIKEEEKGNLKLVFKGKKGVMHDIILSDRALAKLVKKCRDIPGQELFQYYGENGERCSIDSGMINRYIKEITCCDFTAKDFRTWSGTLEALRIYSSFGLDGGSSERKKNTVRMLDEVSCKLGNTRTVCKKYYVFPPLIEAYEKGELNKYLKKLMTAKPSGTLLGADENILLMYLTYERKKAAHNS